MAEIRTRTGYSTANEKTPPARGQAGSGCQCFDRRVDLRDQAVLRVDPENFLAMLTHGSTVVGIRPRSAFFLAGGGEHRYLGIDTGFGIHHLAGQHFGAGVGQGDGDEVLAVFVLQGHVQVWGLAAFDLALDDMGAGQNAGHLARRETLVAQSFTAIIQFADDLNESLREDSIQQYVADHPEKELLAYVQTETAKWLTHIIPEVADKHVMLAVWNRVNCIDRRQRLDEGRPDDQRATNLAACRTLESSAAKRPQRPIFHRLFAP